MDFQKQKRKFGYAMDTQKFATRNAGPDSKCCDAKCDFKNKKPGFFPAVGRSEVSSRSTLPHPPKSNFQKEFPQPQEITMPEADVLKGLSPEMRATVEGNYRANDILGSRDTQLKNEGRELKFAPRDARKARKSVRK